MKSQKELLELLAMGNLEFDYYTTTPANTARRRITMQPGTEQRASYTLTAWDLDKNDYRSFNLLRITNVTLI